MKKIFITILSICLLSGVVFAEESKELTDKKDRLSYSLGADLGDKLKAQAVNIDLDTFMKGLRDGFSGNELVLSKEEIRETLEELRKDLMTKQNEQMKIMAEKNKQEGAAFLEKNKGKEGVVTLPSGLQYKIINEGTGKNPSVDDTVTTHYRGTLIDGTEFDSSYKRGQPATFPVNGVIPGWKEALPLMKEGAKWQLFIPSDLAYGERGAGNLIGPNAALVFDVELISIQPKQ